MLNRIILQGRLGSDPELRNTPAGVEVATVNIAVERDRKGQDGERQADWITITAWRGTARFLASNFSKGRMILVDGRLQTRNYTDRDGNKRTATEVVADNVYFGDSQPNGGSQNNGHTYSAPAPAPAYGYGGNAGFNELTDNEGELPF